MPDEPLERLKRALETQAWRTAGFDSFAEWATAAPPQGLGTTGEELWSTAKRDPEVARAFDRLIPPLQPHGGTWPGAVLLRRLNGATHCYRIGKLKRDRPDLFERHNAGKLSLIDAERAAGFRERTILVPTDPDRLAKALRRRLSDDAVRKVHERLGELLEPR